MLFCHDSNYNSWYFNNSYGNKSYGKRTYGVTSGAWHTMYAMLRSNDISEMISEIHTVERCDFLKPLLCSQMIKCFVIQEQKSESRVYSDFV